MDARDVAQLADIDASNLSRIEKGKYSAGLDILCRIAAAMDCHLDIVPNSNRVNMPGISSQRTIRSGSLLPSVVLSVWQSVWRSMASIIGSKVDITSTSAILYTSTFPRIVNQVPDDRRGYQLSATTSGWLRRRNFGSIKNV